MVVDYMSCWCMFLFVRRSWSVFPWDEHAPWAPAVHGGRGDGARHAHLARLDVWVALQILQQQGRKRPIGTSRRRHRGTARSPGYKSVLFTHFVAYPTMHVYSGITQDAKKKHKLEGSLEFVRLSTLPKVNVPPPPPPPTHTHTHTQIPILLLMRNSKKRPKMGMSAPKYTLNWRRPIWTSISLASTTSLGGCSNKRWLIKKDIYSSLLWRIWLDVCACGWLEWSCISLVRKKSSRRAIVFCYVAGGFRPHTGCVRDEYAPVCRLPRGMCPGLLGVVITANIECNRCRSNVKDLGTPRLFHARTSKYRTPLVYRLWILNSNGNPLLR